MKTYLLLLFAFLGFLGSRAAAQHIPDANFAAGIRSNCPACIDANDSLTASADTLTQLSIANQQITDLTGIEYFLELEYLDASTNYLLSIDVLPNKIKFFNCMDAALSSLPILPDSLKNLICAYNGLTILPNLPNGLLSLDCERNLLVSLPTLPSTLQTLSCGFNRLSNLPFLPLSLLELYASRNTINTLPALPNSLEILSCIDCGLTTLPLLSSNLLYLDISRNDITNLPTLPQNIEILGISQNNITILPNLPNSLRSIDVSDNILGSLPSLPINLSYLNCQGNNLYFLPEFPALLNYIEVSDNPNLKCLPKLSIGLTYLGSANTDVQCLPNIPSGISATTTLPICTSNNINNCPVYADFSGYTYSDNNNNCTYESSTDSILPNSLVVITAANGDTFNIYSDAQGYYSLLLPDSLIVSAQAKPSVQPFFNLCPPSIDTVLQNNTILYLGAQPTIFAPIMEVDIEALLLRRCFESYYMVQYSNVGTIGATNAYVDIEFDSYFAYVSNSANLTTTALGNNTYRFDLGDVAQGGAGSFSVMVDVSCDSELGQVHCTNAHIYPDFTASLANWAGAVIEITDTCMTDSILFQITNTGGAMSTPQTYQIIEDNLMYRPATPFSLASGQSLDVVVPAQEGKIYRIEATQAAGFPAVLGDNPAWAVVQNCNGISSASANFVQQFFTNYGNLSQDNDCEANRGAYDPNDKNAQILGYGLQNCIAANTNLDYKIRFQNTGTDTAFRVFILDTLSVNMLDINTIRMGASSHNYTWELLDNNVLRFVFDNIRLVDSFTNEPLSNGFISFSIDQIADLPVGSVIENSAAIYFDFNAPVITNTAMHTICADFVLLGNTELLQENIQIVALPNPFDNQTIIQISAAQNTPLSLQLYDATGRVVQQLESGNNQFEISRNDLPSGVYFYQIFSAHQPIGRGKLIAR
jgi:hypothetical protein